MLEGSASATIGNVGDSRVYLFRAGALQQLSVDDTFTAALARAGKADPAALNQSLRNLLTQATGSRETLDVHISEQTLLNDDLLLLCSDGLYNAASEASICSVLSVRQPLGDSAKRLLETAYAQGAPDNVSCVLLSYR